MRDAMLQRFRATLGLGTPAPRRCARRGTHAARGGGPDGGARPI